MLSCPPCQPGRRWWRWTEQAPGQCTEKTVGRKKREDWERKERKLGGIFCPITPGGRLAEKWRKIAEDVKVCTNGNVRAKIVEQGGIQLQAILNKPPPEDTDTCPKEDCLPCKSGQTKQKSCHRAAVGGVGYEQQCLLCLQDDKIALYHGETSKTLYKRSTQHAYGLNKKKADNPMYKHMSNFHPGLEPNFITKATKFFSDPLARQINEGVRINNTRSSPGMLMNSKAEFHQGAVARVTVERGLDT